MEYKDEDMELSEEDLMNVQSNIPLNFMEIRQRLKKSLEIVAKKN